MQVRPYAAPCKHSAEPLTRPLPRSLRGTHTGARAERLKYRLESFFFSLDFGRVGVSPRRSRGGGGDTCAADRPKGTARPRLYPRTGSGRRASLKVGACLNQQRPGPPRRVGLEPKEGLACGGQRSIARYALLARVSRDGLAHAQVEEREAAGRRTWLLTQQLSAGP